MHHIAIKEEVSSTVKWWSYQIKTTTTKCKYKWLKIKFPKTNLIYSKVRLFLKPQTLVSYVQDGIPSRPL